MKTEQRVEIVAQAIRRAFGERSNRPKPREWHDLPDQVREAFRIEARAAIAAADSTRA